MTKHKVFISYHHENDQWYKKQLSNMNEKYDIFIDRSVKIGDIDDENMSDEEIRKEIRDKYLRDSTVTIVLVGTETKNRKHVDWEIYSSMYDGKINKKSGIIVVMLPGTHGGVMHIPSYTINQYPFDVKDFFPDMRFTPVPDCRRWEAVFYDPICSYIPIRIKDNLDISKSKIPILTWESIYDNPRALYGMIDFAHYMRKYADYNLTRKMFRRNR